MICVKSNKEIEKMQKAGAITAGALIAAGEAIRPGMTTYELDKVVHRYITSILIVVSVALETARTMESQMMMRHHKGFLE